MSHSLFYSIQHSSHYQLKRFVDGGFEDDYFINGAVNILTRNCPGSSCYDAWSLDEETYVNEEFRRDNFRKIIFDVFSLPMTYQPTLSPTFLPTLHPTRSPAPPSPRPSQEPTETVTAKPTRQKKIKALPPNSAQKKYYNQLTCAQFASLVLVMILLLL